MPPHLTNKNKSGEHLPMLRSKLNDALKHSVKNKDKIAVSTLRLILAALKDRDIAHRTVDADDDGVGEPEILKLLQSMIKQRKDSIDAYLKGGRKDLADNEAEEIEVIKRFLPEQMSTKEVSDAVEDVITKTGAKSIKDMGSVMGVLRTDYSGRMDFGSASSLVKKKLS